MAIFTFTPILQLKSYKNVVIVLYVKRSKFPKTIQYFLKVNSVIIVYLLVFYLYPTPKTWMFVSLTFILWIYVCYSADIEELSFAVAKGEPLITPNVHNQLVESLKRLQKKIFSTTIHKFYRHQVLKTHLLPLTNVAFDKFGKK